MFEKEGHGQAWPQLLHTANSSQVEVWLVGFSPRSNHSRFLLELLAVGGAHPPSRVEIHDSIDDEFTPSIFRVSKTRRTHKLPVCVAVQAKSMSVSWFCSSQAAID